VLIDERIVVRRVCRPGVVARINENGADINLLVGLSGFAQSRGPYACDEYG
jgi:uncharacterized metal-binding protein